MHIKDIFKNIPSLHTPRLILRRMQRFDIDDIFDYAHNPETSKFLLWYPHETKRDTGIYFKNVDKRYKAAEFYDWAIEERVSGRMIGTCGFTSINEIDRKAEIGYVINPRHKGKGYATEAVMRVLEFGFGELGFERIEARYMLGNDRSRRVMDKCYMRYEGIQRHAVFAKGRFFDIGICAVLASDFKKNTQ